MMLTSPIRDVRLLLDSWTSCLNFCPRTTFKSLGGGVFCVLMGRLGTSTFELDRDLFLKGDRLGFFLTSRGEVVISTDRGEVGVSTRVTVLSVAARSRTGTVGD